MNMYENQSEKLTRRYRFDGSVSTYPSRALPPNLPLYMTKNNSDLTGTWIIIIDLQIRYIYILKI